ncbi:type II restriction endonuclease [Pseudomonas fluorescens]|uniref:Restriction endonuclease n=1 Tax=Pseudomonas fluorescens TaxID=294 RepID=A0A0F4V2Q1_PSEFL|nr:type II restriction endonuclease [Pseudomonas fluorescens]KJZ63041.1 restriction endonuclease [Pseudomonas fluorescens]
MFSDRISDYFEGVAAKYLSAVDADPGRSHQHEIGGLPAAGFKQYLGTPGKNEEYRFKAKQIYFTDESVAPDISEGMVTWYDCRRKQPHRSAEFRLYYNTNAVTELLEEGDFHLVAKMRDGSLLMIFTPAGSTIESQLRFLFGLNHVDESFTSGTLDSVQLLLPLRLMLEELGVEVSPVETGDDVWLEQLVNLFGGKAFPTTSAFSVYARKSIEEIVDPLACPDQTIVDWMEHEEKLFRIYERHLVQEQLRSGFGEEGDDVDEFISFSLSVQNRRKSRVGHAFEGHLDEIFRLHGLRFQQGRGKGFVTENNSRPDFIFPGFSEYRDPEFPVGKLIMLGAKTTCKDRWRQVLTEAHRIPVKHLITMEPAISEHQTMEMQSHRLNLVVPEKIKATYTDTQKKWLMCLGEFVELVRQASV